MSIRRYSLVAVVYMVFLFLFVSYLDSTVYSLQGISTGLGFDVSMPISLWFVLSVFAFFLISLAMLVVSNFFASLKENRAERDREKLVSQLCEMSLGNYSKNFSFSEQHTRDLSMALKRFYLVPNIDSVPCNIDAIDSHLSMFVSIVSGNGVDPKKLRLERGHPLYLLNIRNRLNEDLVKPYDVLTQDLINDFQIRSVCPQDVYSDAWRKLLTSGSRKDVLKSLSLPHTHLSVSDVRLLVLSCVKSEIKLDKATLLSIIASSGMNSEHYLDLVMDICPMFKPDNVDFWLSCFMDLSKTDDSSVLGYFYMLLSLEKINEAVDLRSQYPKFEYPQVDAYLDFKDKGLSLSSLFGVFRLRSNRI